MRKLSILAILLGFLPAAASAGVGPVQFKGAGPGNFGHNVRFIGHVPLNNDSAGGRIVGSYFYITSSNSLRIYDISSPREPELVGVLPELQDPYFGEEDLDTNGKILLVQNKVVNVTDKANPVVIGTHSVDAHTISCVLDCTWAYGSEGQIVDLRNPAAPRVSAKRWGTGKPSGSGHDVTEISPGLVVTSTDPVQLIDARTDPENPTLLAKSNTRNRFVHGNLWPNAGTDRFMLVGGETGGPSCSGASAQFVTMDTQGWQDGAQFRQVAEYRVSTGLPNGGQSPANQYCAHWFDEHPRYDDGGVVAMAWYEHGTRFLRIGSNGSITEVGWFIPAGGSTSAAYWVTDRLLYLVDYNRGFDIVEFTGQT